MMIYSTDEITALVHAMIELKESLEKKGNKDFTVDERYRVLFYRNDLIVIREYATNIHLCTIMLEEREMKWYNVIGSDYEVKEDIYDSLLIFLPPDIDTISDFKSGQSFNKDSRNYFNKINDVQKVLKYNDTVYNIFNMLDIAEQMGVKFGFYLPNKNSTIPETIQILKLLSGKKTL